MAEKAFEVEIVTEPKFENGKPVTRQFTMAHLIHHGQQVATFEHMNIAYRCADLLNKYGA